MDIRTQALPPGWRIEATGPFPDGRRCVLQLTGPDGESAVWEVDADAAQIEAVRRLAAAMALTGDTYREEDGSPGTLLAP